MVRARKSLLWGSSFSLTLAPAAVGRRQEIRGRITGVVTDNTGAVLPGVTVTVSGRRSFKPQTTVIGRRWLVPVSRSAAGALRR